MLPSEMDRTLGRAVTMARFMGSRQFELINAELVRFVGTEMILSGLERHYTESGGSADYAQGWLIQILPG